ncbi:cytochrome P450 302a1, mitochondrial [Orussus abietinus]|uniref:cytochrome P450 302a1, mitochondrial n=1 Tax=Orussus abietinus TaxID=222816 RepID=UPI0006252821|nr:cytochrome P450 302a1, mitochondrial [Orussus abietinus]
MYLRVGKCRELPKTLRWTSSSSSTNNIQDFRDIPGPKSLPVIGTLYKYLPLIGEYSFKKLHKVGAKKLARYGPLVREEMVPGVNILWVFHPDDIFEVFRAEGRSHPERRSHLALLKYRGDRPEVYNNGGLLPTNGTEWWRLRREFQKALSKPQSVLNYLEDTDAMIEEFVDLCATGDHEDVLPLLSRLFLELTSLVAFDVKMKSFSKEEMQRNSRSSRLIDAALTTNTAILKLDNGLRLWRFFDTPLYRKLCRAQAYMEEVALDMVSRKLESQDSAEAEKESLLEVYLKNPNLDRKDVVGMACDMLLAGIDTTTYSTAFALYHLARNPRAQDTLHEEAANLLKDENAPIDSTVLRRANFAKAVMKETFRLNPISVGVGRVLQKDAVLRKYRVPKGTVIVTQNQVACRLPEYFPDPDSFLPERWLREETKSRVAHPYLVLPFGHGPRSCIARRLAEQNMQVLLLRVCRKLRFSWRGGDLDSQSLLINKPDAPIKLEFSRR